MVGAGGFGVGGFVGLACWRLVGCRWSAMVGPFLAPGYAWRCGVGLGATWAHVGAMLAHLAAMWAHFGAMWAHLGAMWAQFGARLAHLGAMLAHLGAMLAHLNAYVGPSRGLSWHMLTHLKPPDPKKAEKCGEHKTP